MLLVGIVALFITPVLLATLAVTIEAKAHAHWQMGWWTCLGLSSLAIIPALFWIESRSRGQWMQNQISGESITVGEALLSPARVAAGGMTWSAIAEVFMPAPRMILAARERWRTPISAATLHDAAAVINFLRHSDDGVAVDDLPTVQPLRVLCYLVSREWVGVSHLGDRVWLLESAKADVVP